jgi:hypothetical protein
MQTRRGINQAVTGFAAICLLSLLTGCEELPDSSLTYKLWSGDFAMNHYQPATNANLRVFQSRNGKDLMVEYNEENEKNGKVHPRAYLLLANEHRVELMKRPHFKRVKSVNKLEEYPVLTGTDTLESAPATVWAVIDPDKEVFSVYRDGQASGPYYLPTYVDPKSEIERAVLTPPAVVGDVALASAIVGGFVGVAVLEGMANSGGWSYSWRP